MSSSRTGFDATRRQALQLLSASIATAMAGCGQPLEEIVPYVNMPEREVPGLPRRYATALPLAGYGRGILGITVDGRPIKIEGNPHDTFSGGGTDVFAEASVLSLYDPDRTRAPLKGGIVASWEQFAGEWANGPVAQYARGQGMALVTGRLTSPTLLKAVAALKAKFPELRHYRYEPVHDDTARAGARLAFTRNVDAVPNFAAAGAVVVLDGDPLGPGPLFLHNAAQFSLRRNATPPQKLHVAESGLTLMGAMADRRIGAPPQRITAIAMALASALGHGATAPGLTPQESDFVRQAAADLRQPGRGLIVAGPAQPPQIHALVHFLNSRLAAPIDYLPPGDPEDRDHADSFNALLRDLDSRSIRALIVLDSNPVFDAANGQDAARSIAAIPFSVHCGTWSDETAASCQWHLPLAHSLESWGDLRSPGGSVLLQQPLIRPLYDTRSHSELLNLLAMNSAGTSRDIVRATWMPMTTGNFEQWWREALTSGQVPNSALPTVSVMPAIPPLPALQNAPTGLTLTLAPSPVVWDGRFANSAWLQECPAPFTKEVWGNAVQLSPEDAERIGVAYGDGIVLRHGNREVEAVAAVLKGHPSGVAKGFIGQGRWKAGAIGNGIGVRLASLTDQNLPQQVDAITLRASGKTGLFHTTQYHTRLDGRDEDIYPLAEASRITERLGQLKPDTGGIVPPLPPDEYAWAMVIDNNLCIGCNACVIACQAENNVGVVGPAEVDLGRDMHWLRIDVYELDQPDGFRRGFQPIPCMHCETAPCEPVCPVEASVHDHEGLNVQVYNRCIGTRFCESNCPYKVRRFNFFGYTKGQEYANLGQPPVRAQHNPNVSVRGRGVMEKCTYCVQRISSARKDAEKEDRPIRDGEVVTACAAACPTRAITFGNRNDPKSAVARLQKDERHFSLLAHLDTRPRTTYLAKIYHSIASPAGDAG